MQRMPTEHNDLDREFGIAGMRGGEESLGPVESDEHDIRVEAADLYLLVIGRSQQSAAGKAHVVCGCSDVRGAHPQRGVSSGASPLPTRATWMLPGLRPDAQSHTEWFLPPAASEADHAKSTARAMNPSGPKPIAAWRPATAGLLSPAAASAD